MVGWNIFAETRWHLVAKPSGNEEDFILRRGEQDALLLHDCNCECSSRFVERRAQAAQSVVPKERKKIQMQRALTGKIVQQRELCVDIKT